MREIMRTNDIVILGVARSVLEEADVPHMVADAHMSVVEGSIGMFPRRLLVVDDAYDEARRLLTEADLGDWLLAP